MTTVVVEDSAVNAESDELAGPTIEIPLMMAGGELDAPRFQAIERMAGTPAAVIIDPVATRVESERRPRIVMPPLER